MATISTVSHDQFLTLNAFAVQIARHCSKFAGRCAAASPVLDRLMRTFDGHPEVTGIAYPISVSLVGEREAVIWRDKDAQYHMAWVADGTAYLETIV